MRSNTGEGPFQPWSKQTYLCVCSGVVALLPWAKEAGSFIYLLLFFNGTQVSCVFRKLSHFLFHRKKIRLSYRMLEIRMMYPKHFWCVSSVCCVCGYQVCIVSYTRSWDEGVLPSIEQDCNALSKSQK